MQLLAMLFVMWVMKYLKSKEQTVVGQEVVDGVVYRDGISDVPQDGDLCPLLIVLTYKKEHCHKRSVHIINVTVFVMLFFAYT